MNIIYYSVLFYIIPKVCAIYELKNCKNITMDFYTLTAYYFYKLKKYIKCSY